MPIGMQRAAQVTMTLFEDREVEAKYGLHTQRLEWVQLSGP